MLRMRAEEADGRLVVLAASVSRPRWMINHLLNAGLGALLLLLVFAVEHGRRRRGGARQHPGQLRALVEAGLVRLPAILLIAGVVVALTALLPRTASALSGRCSWWRSCSGRCSARQRSSCHWAQNVSPFTHTPKLPGAELAALPVFSLIVISAALVAAALASARGTATSPSRREATAGTPEGGGMTVLVTAASKHGATLEIETIARVLEEHGLPAEFVEIDEVGDLGGYNAYIVGSGIYLGNWLKEARRFVDDHAAELAQRPTWLFASGSIVGDPPVDDDPNALRAGLAEQLVETTRARAQAVRGQARQEQAWLGRKAARADGARSRGRLARLGGRRQVGGGHRARAAGDSGQRRSDDDGGGI